MAKKLLDRFGSETEFIASNIEQSSTVNGLTATNVQDAIDEIVVNIGKVEMVSAVNGVDLIKSDGTSNELRFSEIDSTTSNPKMVITIDGTVVYTQDLNKNDIQINNSGSDWDLTDDILSIVETNGDTQTISFAKYNITINSNANNDIDIYQNGVLVGIISQNATGIKFDNTSSGLTSTTVQGAIDEIVSNFSNTTQEKEETFASTAGQTTFTLSTAPIGAIHFFRNGVKLATNSATYTATTVTYNPTNNGGNVLVAGDRITISYEG